MKNDLTCGVVRDLLPSYVEGLLGEESRQAVNRHLTDCPACAAALSAMQAPEEAAVQEEGPPPDVDYLKKVKKRNKRKIAAAVACTVLVLLAAFLYQIFERGTPLDPGMVGIAELSASKRDGHNTLHISLGTPSSAIAFHGWGTKTWTEPDVEVGEISYLTARKVLVSPLHQDGGVTLDIPLNDDQKEYWLGGPSGRLLWQDGVVISQTALDLMDAKAPYCGDPAALDRIAAILHLPDRLGSYTVSLQTAQPPYGWTLECANPLNQEQLQLAACYNILALALVDNLEVSRLLYTDRSAGSGPTSAELTQRLDQLDLNPLVDAYNAAHGTDWEAKASVKDYAATPADLQRLLLMLDGFYGTSLSDAP